MSLEPGALHARKVGILECVRVELAKPPSKVPGRVCTVPGHDIAWDDCDCAGLLAVHHTVIVPSKHFPQQDFDGPFTKCEPPLWVVDIVVTVLRCSPETSDQTTVPCSALEAAAVIQDRDVEAMQRGVECCLKGIYHRIGEHVTVGAAGLCVGSQLTVQTAFPNCVTCP